MRAPSLRPLSFRPIDDVESSLIESWRSVSQATLRFLVLLREFDLRQGWKAYGHMHEGGFAIQRNGDGTYCFTRPDGRPIEMRHSAECEVREARPRYRVALGR